MASTSTISRSDFLRVQFYCKLTSESCMRRGLSVSNTNCFLFFFYYRVNVMQKNISSYSSASSSAFHMCKSRHIGARAGGRSEECGAQPGPRFAERKRATACKRISAVQYQRQLMYLNFPILNSLPCSTPEKLFRHRADEARSHRWPQGRGGSELNSNAQQVRR